MKRILLSATMIPKEYFCVTQWSPNLVWNAQSDPEAHAWFNNGRAARFKSFDFGRFCATVLQLCATVLQLCATVLMCKILLKPLTLVDFVQAADQACSVPLAPSNSASRAEQQTIASSSHNVNKCITHCASLHLQTIASQCIWTIVPRRYLHSIWEDCLRARRSLLIKFVCTARTIADCLFPIANCPQSSCLTWQRQVHSWCNFGKYFATGYRTPVWFDY